MSDNNVKFPTDGFYVIPESSLEKPYLIGSECGSCGEIYFPKKTADYCTHCHYNSLREVRLSRTGVVAAFTVSEQAPSGGFYKGKVPYAYGFVDLPEGVRILTQFATDFETLQIGKTVELTIEKIAEDNTGSAIVSYMFK